MPYCDPMPSCSISCLTVPSSMVATQSHRACRASCNSVSPRAPAPVHGILAHPRIARRGAQAEAKPALAAVKDQSGMQDARLDKGITRPATG